MCMRRFLVTMTCLGKIFANEMKKKLYRNLNERWNERRKSFKLFSFKFILIFSISNIDNGTNVEMNEFPVQNAIENGIKCKYKCLYSDRCQVILAWTDFYIKIDVESAISFVFFLSFFTIIFISWQKKIIKGNEMPCKVKIRCRKRCGLARQFLLIFNEKVSPSKGLQM